MCAAEKYIRLDGVLVLRLVADIAGDMAATRILLTMWKRYLVTWNKTTSSMCQPASSTLKLSQLHEKICERKHTTLPGYCEAPSITLSLFSNNKWNLDATLLLITEKISGYPQNWQTFRLDIIKLQILFVILLHLSYSHILFCLHFCLVLILNNTTFGEHMI